MLGFGVCWAKADADASRMKHPIAMEARRFMGAIPAIFSRRRFIAAGRGRALIQINPTCRSASHTVNFWIEVRRDVCHRDFGAGITDAGDQWCTVRWVHEADITNRASLGSASCLATKALRECRDPWRPLRVSECPLRPEKPWSASCWSTMPDADPGSVCNLFALPERDGVDPSERSFPVR